MIISKKYAQKLACLGKATIEPYGKVLETHPVISDGMRFPTGIYQIVTRHDKQRVDHYFIRKA